MKAPPHRRRGRQQRRTDLIGFLFILPNLLGFLLFVAIPLVFSFILGFFSWDAITRMKFVGLKNYANLFLDDGFLISLANTFYYTVVSVPLTASASASPWPWR